MALERTEKVLALSGGVGGAKLALGLSKVLASEQLTVVANTADDFEHFGLSISPDLDTLMYTLAGINDQKQGWGLAGESWQTLETLKKLGQQSWFQLGDRDIATHLVRSDQLRQGASLSEVTAALSGSLGVECTLLPMSDDPVRTMVETDQGQLGFQHYFVRQRCQPSVSGFYFAGINQAQPQAEFLSLLQSADLTAIVICPSNPFVSVDPILQLSGVREAMIANPAPVIAISPIVAGTAIKGPTAKIMSELNMPTTALTVAEYYGELLDGFVIDQSDIQQIDAIGRLGIEVLATATLMHSLDSKIVLANQVLAFAQSFSGYSEPEVARGSIR